MAEWSDWINEPYLGAVNDGDYVFIYLMLDGVMRSWEGIATQSGLSKLTFGYDTPDNKVVRYRIKTPKGMDVLNEILRSVECGRELV